MPSCCRCSWSCSTCCWSVATCGRCIRPGNRLQLRAMKRGLGIGIGTLGPAVFIWDKIDTLHCHKTFVFVQVLTSNRQDLQTHVRCLLIRSPCPPDFMWWKSLVPFTVYHTVGVIPLNPIFCVATLNIYKPKNVRERKQL